MAWNHYASVPAAVHMDATIDAPTMTSLHFQIWLSFRCCTVSYGNEVCCPQCPVRSRAAGAVCNMLLYTFVVESSQPNMDPTIITVQLDRLLRKQPSVFREA